MFIAAAMANPMVDYGEAYMHSEDLTISIEPGGDAAFSGKFEFQPLPQYQTPSMPVELEIPIWIPETASDKNGALAHFLAAIRLDRWKPLEGEIRALFEEVIGLKIESAGKSVPYDGFWVAAYKKTGKDVPAEKKYPEVLCLTFRVLIDASQLKEGSKLMLTYRQPLIQAGDSEILFYRPIFKNISPETLGKNSANYRITVRTKGGMKLEPQSDLKYRTKPASDELNIIPEHEKPIIIKIKK